VHDLSGVDQGDQIARSKRDYFFRTKRRWTEQNRLSDGPKRASLNVVKDNHIGIALLERRGDELGFRKRRDDGNSALRENLRQNIPKQGGPVDDNDS
jgi:hypothetical protein